MQRAEACAGVERDAERACRGARRRLARPAPYEPESEALDVAHDEVDAGLSSSMSRTSTTFGDGG
ncbi:MAG: hypothetical protein KIS78_17530 [Labilithrix sp.]|nr:hypothetical protein [Labilithrix sp.]